MKKTTNSLLMAIIFSLLLVIIVAGCSKSDPNPNSPPVVIVPPSPEKAPIGTAVATRSTISYNDKDTINFAFTGATKGIWVNNVFQGLNQSGSYITSSLTNTTTFVVVAKSKDSVTTVSIPITVNPDPNITFLTNGTFVMESYRFKPPDNVSTVWINSPNFECNSHVFLTNGTEKMTYGPCTSTPGNVITTQWYFIYNSPLMQTGLFWHGVTFDKFTKVSETKFVIHNIGPVLIGGTLYPDGEIEETFHKL